MTHEAEKSHMAILDALSGLQAEAERIRELVESTMPVNEWDIQAGIDCVREELRDAAQERRAYSRPRAMGLVRDRLGFDESIFISRRVVLAAERALRRTDACDAANLPAPTST